MSKQTILIVEDEKDLILQYQLFCQLAIDSFENSDNEEIVIKSATSVDDAALIIDQENVIFISADLALRASETNLSAKDRNRGLEPGGIKLLKYLQDRPYRPISIVVSGETLPSYPRDALQIYNVFAFYEKSDPQLMEQYQHSIKASLYYVKAVNLVSEIEAFNEGLNLLETVELNWKNAIREAISANASERSFPVDLNPKIKELKREIDSDVKIPSPKWTEHVLRKLRIEEDNWMLIRARIENFSIFVGPQQSQIGPLLYFIAESLKKNLSSSGFHIEYIGLWKSEIAGPCVIVAIKSPKEKSLDFVFREINNEFRESAEKFTHNPKLMAADVATQNIAPDLGLKFWSNKEFSDWHDLMDKIGSPFPSN